jgi:hypothetical protein
MLSGPRTPTQYLHIGTHGNQHVSKSSAFNPCVLQRSWLSFAASIHTRPIAPLDRAITGLQPELRMLVPKIWMLILPKAHSRRSWHARAIGVQHRRHHLSARSSLAKQCICAHPLGDIDCAPLEANIERPSLGRRIIHRGFLRCDNSGMPHTIRVTTQ